MLVVGLMSGTSADGVDAAVVEIGRSAGRLSVRAVAFVCTPHPADLRQEILACCDPATGSVDRICRLNARLGEAFATGALAAVEAAGREPREVDLIASHGQTIYHATQPGEAQPSTLQIAAPAVLAERTGVTVVADFRPADVATGGQGAPLVPLVDYLLFAQPEKSRVVLNVGGIANLTHLPAGAPPEMVRAFDTGPGNMVIDALADRFLGEHFDRDGRAASRGRVDSQLLDELLNDDYFDRPPPKSTGREEFGRPYAEKLARRGLEIGLAADDLIATATALTATTIAGAIRRFVGPVDELVLGGGGVRNSTLVGQIAAQLPGIGMLRHEDLGIDSDAKEALAFAVLGYETVFGRPGNLPRCTGASRPVVLGSITPGRNFRRLISLVAGAGDD